MNPEPGRQLNPFALPAETTSRFLLLAVGSFAVAYAVGIALIEWQLRPVFDLDDSTWETSDYLRAMDEAGYAQSRLGAFVVWFPGRLITIGLPLCGGAIALAAGLVLYTGHPARIRRRYRLTAFDPDRDTRFSAALGELTALTGVATPQIEMDNHPQSTDGQAFGLEKRYSLRLGGGLRLLLRKSPEMFRAVLLHELAHIANGDIRRAYIAQSLWVVTLVLLAILGIYLHVAALIDAFGVVLTGGALLSALAELRIPLLVSAQIGLIIAALAAIRAGLLRIREVYADWRAALWGGREGLEAIFEAQAHKSPPRWGALWRLHPAPSERLATLRRPERLFSVTADLALVAGFQVGFVMSGILLPAIGISTILSAVGDMLNVMAARVLLPFGQRAALTATSITLVLSILMLMVGIAAAIGLIGYLGASTAGLQIQREAAADFAAGRRGPGPYLRQAIPAAIFGFGLQLGVMAFPLSPLGSIYLPNGWIMLVTFPVQAGLAFGLAWLWMAFVRFFSLRILASHRRQAPPRKAFGMLTVAASLLLAGFLLPMVALSGLIGTYANSLRWDWATYSPALVGAGASPIVTLAVMGGIMGLLTVGRRIFGRAQAASIDWLLI